MRSVVKTDRREPPPEFGSAYSEDEVRAMQRAVINVFARWGVSDVDAATILGGISAKTFRRWKDRDYGRVGRDLADRMSHLLGIHKALRIIFSDPHAGYAWVRSDNAAFQGKSALEIMKYGGMEHIVRIRRYLESVRSG